MYRRTLLGALAVVTSPLPLVADLANGHQRLQRLFSAFMAPCCWRENLSVHKSPKADELRARIRQDVANGLSDDQIKQSMLAEFTKQILANPEGASGNWLRYGPWVATGFGLVALTWVIRSSLANAALARQAQSTNIPAALPDSDWE